MQKLDCTHTVTLTECQDIIEYFDRENLVPLINKLVAALEFSIEILIQGQNQANHLLDNFHESIEKTPNSTCQTRRNTDKQTFNVI